MTKNAALISPEDVAQRLGKKNPETIRAALRAGTFPIGCTYNAGGKTVYAIPREPFERFMETGQFEPPANSREEEILAALRDIQETLAILKAGEVA